MNFARTAAIVSLLAGSAGAFAQADADTAPPAHDTVSPHRPKALQVAADDEGKSSPTFFVAQRAWYASWNTNLLDAQITANGGTPQLETSITSGVTSSWMPVTSLGVRVGDVTAIASVFPSTKFAGEGLAAGQKRSEFDLALGYNLSPSVTALVIYKQGKVSPATTVQAAQLLQFNASEKGGGIILGLNGVTPVNDKLSLYGNVAYGPSRWKIEGNSPVTSRFSGSYSIVDLGLAYRFDTTGILDGFKAVNLQLGYRSQTVEFNDVDLPIYSVGPGPVQQIGNRRKDVSSSTYGFIFGISSAF
jgi:hypothetical protein